jgi:hypothetical protein
MKKNRFNKKHIQILIILNARNIIYLCLFFLIFFNIFNKFIEKNYLKYLLYIEELTNER